MRRILFLLLMMTVVACDKKPEPARPAVEKPLKPRVEPAAEMEVLPAPREKVEVPAYEQDLTRYNGKLLKEWLALMDQTPVFDDSVHSIPGNHYDKVGPYVEKRFAANSEGAKRIMISAGGPAIPFLADVVMGKEPGPRLKAVLALYQIAREHRYHPNKDLAVDAFIHSLSDVDLNIQSAALMGMQAMGPEAVKAAPALREHLRKKPISEVVEALWAVSNNKDDVTPALRNLLNDKQPDDRIRAARLAGNMKADAAELVDSLVELIDDKDSAVRDEAAKALGQIGAPAKKALPRLLKLAETSDSETLARTLGQFGTDAAPAIPHVCRAFKNSDSSNRATYADALFQMGPTCVPEVVKILLAREASEFLRDHAAQLLGRFGAQAKTAVGDLAGVLREPPHYLRISAANALGKIGPDAKAAIPELQRLAEETKDADEFTAAMNALPKIGADWPLIRAIAEKTLERPEDKLRKHAARFVGEQAKDMREALPALVKSLKKANKEDLWNYISAMGQFGSAASDHAEVLCELLGSKDLGTFKSAAAALTKIGPDNPAVVPALAKALKRNNFDGGPDAADALASFGPRAKAALPDLIREIEKFNGFGTDSYLIALSAFGPDAKDAVPALKAVWKNAKVADNEFLRNRQGENQIWAAFALYQIEQNKEAFDWLVASLRANQAHIVLLAAKALSKLGPAAKPALPELLAAMKNASQYDRHELAELIRNIDPSVLPK